MTTPLAVRRRKVVLHGHLAEAVGHSELMLAVRSPAQAVRLIEANFPNIFSRAMSRGEYHVMIGHPTIGVSCGEKLLDFQFPDGDIHFIPAITGAGMGKGMMMVLVGVSILAIALTGGAAAGGLLAGFGGGAGTAGAVGLSAGLGTSIFGGVTWGTVALLGTAIALSGISILLTPTPKTDDVAKSELSSFLFSGPVNTTKEGVCVPLGYGRLIVGSVVVSAGLYTEKLAVTDASNAISGFDTNSPFYPVIKKIAASQGLG